MWTGGAEGHSRRSVSARIKGEQRGGRQVVLARMAVCRELDAYSMHPACQPCEHGRRPVIDPRPRTMEPP